MEDVKLDRTWTVGERLGAGGFGEVFRATTDGDDTPYAIKLMDKLPGGDRETLFANMEGKVNIMSVVDYGETADKYVIVMPMADYSLKDYLSNHTEGISTKESIGIINNIVDSLVSLEGSVVHRDIKPGNVLFHEGVWRLADFGISKYVEDSTSANTKKDVMSAAYAAPERWRHEKQTQKSDIYSLGVVAYELLSGDRPFLGPEAEDYRHQHLEQLPAVISGITPLLSALVLECLYKPEGSRPSATVLKARLSSVAGQGSGIIIPSLQQANLAETERIAAKAAEESAAMIRHTRRKALATVAASELEALSMLLRETIVTNSPNATIPRSASASWLITSGITRLSFSPIDSSFEFDQKRGFGFDVVATGSIELQSNPNHYGYQGRSHSLWYCDAEVEGEYSWYEVAFMNSVLIQQIRTIEPFAAEPYDPATDALNPTIGRFQMATNFSKLSTDRHTEFVTRWATMLGDASKNGAERPTTMPENPPIVRNWR